MDVRCGRERPRMSGEWDDGLRVVAFSFPRPRFVPLESEVLGPLHHHPTQPAAVLTGAMPPPRPVFMMPLTCRAVGPLLSSPLLFLPLPLTLFDWPFCPLRQTD